MLSIFFTSKDFKNNLFAGMSDAQLHGWSEVMIEITINRSGCIEAIETGSAPFGLRIFFYELILNNFPMPALVAGFPRRSFRYD